MRLFVRILLGVGGLLVLLLIAVAVAVWAIDVNQFVGPIQARVKEATGRDLEIRGGIDFKLSLEPKLVLEDVTLGNVAWGKQPQMLTAKRVEAQVALLPLLQRRFEVVQFKLIEPKISLETDANGRTNWDFATSAVAAPAKDASADRISAKAGGAFGIADLAISNGALTFLQGSTGDVTTVTIDSLSLHAIDPESPLTGEFHGKVNDISLALEGNFGPLESLTQRRWPYPISMHGEINGQKASIDTKARVVDGTVGLEDLNVAVGATQATGQVTMAPGPTRPKLSIQVKSKSMSTADLPALGAGLTAANAVAAQPSRKSKSIVSNAPVSMASLQAYDTDADVTIDQLTLAEGRHLNAVRARFTVRDGKLDAPELKANAYGGTIVSQLKVDATNAAAPIIALRVDGKGFDLAALLAAFGIQSTVTGGKTDVTVDVTTAGASAKDWTARLNGNVLATVGPAQVPAATLNLDASYVRLLDAINPFRRSDPVTQLQCAVVRLPLRNGVASIDRSIALETSKISGNASGTIDFRDETLDLGFKPQVKPGMPSGVIDIASMVRLKGTFASPAVTIDSVGSAATVARIGAAVGTSGMSVIGESLLKGATSNGESPCQVAMGATAAASATSSTSSPSTAASVTTDVSKAIGKIFGR